MFPTSIHQRFFFFNLFCPIIILLILTLYAVPAFSQVRYVSDFLIVNLKDNIERPFSVVGKVKSNDKVKIIEENGRFAKVVTEDGKEGWIAKQYLKNSLPKTAIIAQQEKQLEELKEKLSSFQLQPANDTMSNGHDLELIKEKNQHLETVNESLRDQLKNLQTTDPDLDLIKLKKENIALKTKLEAQQKSLTESRLVEKEFQHLKVQYTNLLHTDEDTGNDQKDDDKLIDVVEKQKTVIMELQIENENLKTSSLIYWFLAGAIVFLSGVILGKIGTRRKNRFSY